MKLMNNRICGKKLKPLFDRLVFEIDEIIDDDIDSLALKIMSSLCMLPWKHTDVQVSNIHSVPFYIKNVANIHIYSDSLKCYFNIFDQF